MIDRKALVQKAVRMAMAVRQNYDIPLNSPICPFDLATDKLQIDLRFVANASLEGMYSRSPTAILIGSERPRSRQAYTCAHEIGHHVFGHGTHVDEIADDEAKDDDPDEFLVQVFAGFLLMPKMAVDLEFSKRGISPTNCSHLELYSIASYFGVGFVSFLNHLAYSLTTISPSRAEEFKKIYLTKLRKEFGSPDDSRPLVVAERFSSGRPVDLEMGDILLTPPDSQHEGLCLLPMCRKSSGCFWEAVQQGTSRIVLPESGEATFVRVRPKQFHGRAIYRHMPETEDEK